MVDPGTEPKCRRLKVATRGCRVRARWLRCSISVSRARIVRWQPSFGNVLSDYYHNFADALYVLRNHEGDREDVYLHLARVKMLGGRLAEARSQLNSVTNESCAKLKAALLRGIEERQKAEPNSAVPREAKQDAKNL